MMMLEQRQSMSLVQRIDLAKMMEVPDEVINLVIGAITYNPNSVEEILKQRKMPKGNGGNNPDSANNVQAVYSELSPSSKGDNPSKKTGGLIGSPNLDCFYRNVEGRIVALTPDVTYIGRELKLPEIVFSDHIVGTTQLVQIQLEESEFPETTKLIKAIRKFDSWKRGALRGVYVAIAEEQRVFFEQLDKTKLTVYNQNNLASRMGYHESTVSRILNNLWVEARSIEGDKKTVYAKDLLVSKDHFKRFQWVKQINSLLEEELRRGKALSDQELTNNVRGIARRTVTKYRTDSDIPNHKERNDSYESGNLTEPYQIVDW